MEVLDHATHDIYTPARLTGPGLHLPTTTLSASSRSIGDVAFLHAHHVDLKPANIVVRSPVRSDENHISSTSVTLHAAPPQTSMQDTRSWTAPKVWTGNP
ncbi:hypothetical protein FRB95_013548 [Tulasnella sp. JGI-2019a]|nr:hypothetical protein FRB95_013548 [Tulasnella sp. JGI-2019a]